MFLSRISSILRCSFLSPKKVLLTNSIPKCEFCRTLNLYSEVSDKPPKKPMPMFLRFFYASLPDLKAKFPDRNYRELRVICGVLWRTLDISGKKPYIQSYHEDFDKYLVARLKYQCETKDKPKNEEQPLTKQEKRKLKNLRKLSGKPNRPMNAFFIFLKTKRGKLPKDQVMVWIKDLVSEYKNLKADEKAKYQEEANKSKENYRKKISEWENSLIKNGWTDLLFKRSKFEEKD